jgi:hypothetical protein
MLEWLGSDGEAMRVAFTKVFGSGPRPFGSPSLKVGGLSDGAEGVQWNVAFDPRDGRQTVGVNLEGITYDDWPIARLIERELDQPTLPLVISRHPGLADVVLLWRREHWQAGSRLAIRESEIAPTPIALEDLGPADWRNALDSAWECLDTGRRRRGRARQTVTLLSGKRVEDAPVSPHLTFEFRARDSRDWEPMLREARATMRPLYEWTKNRAARPVRF